VEEVESGSLREQTASNGFVNHPWVTIWFNPRATIRRAMGSGRVRDPALVATVWGLSLGVVCAAAPSRTLPPGSRILIVTFAVVVGTLLMTGVIYMNGALRAWGGRKIGGKATVAELSEALALSQIPFLSWFVLGAIFAICVRFIYGDTPPVGAARPAPLWAYPLLGFGAALFVWSAVLRKNCFLEVQGFSAAQGRRAFWIGMRRYLLLLVLLAALVELLPVATVAVGRVFQHFRS
jgi:hypothetical protein